ncbi:MAG: right-handed parallel beta-helix repeat-containing protein [Candidatus Thorarchaeota archaeon]|nr:MAG: right-handed parallel beta-helix repeat-containing protein [Candidatus Thorarchaeota archaeon]
MATKQRGSHHIILSFLVAVFILTMFTSLSNNLETRLLDSEAKGDDCIHESRLLTGNPHSNITIANDTDFAQQKIVESWSGNGSEGNPYIIEGYDIDMASGPGRCIEIRNTRVHFIIQDCYLTGASQTQGIGIYLENVTNAAILRNTVSNCWRAIHLATSWNINIEDTTCSASDLAVALVLSHNNTVVDSVMSDAIHGLHLDTSHQNELDNNTCIKNTNGIYLTSSNLNNITRSNCTGNTEDGIKLASSTQNLLFNNTSSKNEWHGIDLRFTDQTMIAHNTHSYAVEFMVAEEEPPTWDETPEDQYVYPWTSLSWDLNASDPSGIDAWWVNDTVNFAIDANGILTNATILTHGNYGIRVFVNDTNGNILTYDLTVYVDLIAPYIHAPITINGDADFASIAQKEGWQGNGSITNPYIIENWHINVVGLSVDCIEIRNTNAYFVIRFCLLEGDKVWFRYGVDLFNVDNGTLSNNTFIALHRAVQLEASSYSLIANNTCLNSTYGIRLVDSNEWNDIVNNTCRECWRSIELWTGSNNNYVGGNFVTNGESEGINVEGCSYITIESNFVTNCLSGINSYNSFDIEISNNTCSGSSTGINMAGCERFTVLNNVLFLNNRGISASLSNWSHFTNNSISDQSQMGISIESNCHHNIFSNNTCIRNEYGIRVWYGNCVNNSFYWNVLVNSTVDDAYDVGTDSVFDYNHYSDYSGTDLDLDWIGDTSHSIVGGAGTVDLHPLMYPPFPFDWNETLADQNLEIESPLLVELGTNPPAPMGYWSINDTVHFAVDEWGVISNSTPLSLGTYGVEVVASNIYGIRLIGAFSIHVAPGSPPRWVETPVDQLIEYGEALLYDLDATDPSGIDRWWVDDTIRFSIDWQGRLCNATTLTPDDYGVEIFVSDIHGYTISARILVQVRDTTPPDWTVSIHDIVITYGTPFEYQFSAWDLSGIDGWEVNDTARFAVDDTGLVTNRVVLQVGEYNLAITVSDSYGNSRTAIIALSVQQTGPGFADLNQVLTLAIIAGSVIGGVMAVMAFASWLSKRRIAQAKQKQKEE